MTAPKPDFADRPPWTRPGFIAAAAVVVLIVLAGLAIALGADRSPPAPGPAASKDGGGSPAPGPSAALPTARPTAAPAGVTWQLLGQVALPYSAADGPRVVTATTAAGFAHTPVGALIAAKQLSTRSGLSAGKSVYEPVIAHQFVPSADRDRLLAQLRAADQQPASPGELSQLVGFIYNAYTPDTAVIGLVRRAPSSNSSPRYFATTFTLEWHDGDWQMVAPPAGSWLSLSREVTGLTGVVEWGPR